MHLLWKLICTLELEVSDPTAFAFLKRRFVSSPNVHGISTFYCFNNAMFLVACRYLYSRTNFIERREAISSSEVAWGHDG
jgi:hypothetical protein